MSIKVIPLDGGTNVLQTTSEEVSRMLSWYFSEGVPPTGSIGAGTPVTGDFAVQAQSSPNKTVKVKAGNIVLDVTPTAGVARHVLVTLSADSNVTIADNDTGSTRYDKVYLYLDPDTLANPPANGDFTEALALKVQRDSAAGTAITDTNSYLLAEIVVADGFTEITNANITDSRTYSTMNAAKGVTDASITTAKLDAEKKKGWDKIASTLTRQSATTASGTDLLDYIEVGDKVKLDQSIPLTAYFPLEDKDSDVGSFTVANIGSPDFTQNGKFGKCFTGNGTDMALAITDDALLKPTGPFTIGMWFKTSATGAFKQLFNSWSSSTHPAGIQTYIGTTNKLYFEIADNNSLDIAISGNTVVTDGNLHYVEFVYQGNFGKIFLDGNLEASGYLPTPAYAATNYVRVGCTNNSGTNVNWFSGQIDDLFFINGHAVDEYWVAAKYAEATAQGTGNITATYKGYVTAVTDTLLTVTGGADYALYNGTITNPYYSKASSPVGFPDVFNWSPTETHIVGGNKSYKFRVNGHECKIFTRISDFTSDGANPVITPPITPKSGQDYLGACNLYTGSADIHGICLFSSTNIMFVPGSTLGTGTKSTGGNFMYLI